MGFGVVVLRAEAEGEDVGHRARLRDGAPEGVVGVRRHDLARLGDVGGDVAVGVAEGEVPRSADLGGEEAADAARAVKCAGEVAAPHIEKWRMENGEWRIGIGRLDVLDLEAPAAEGEVVVSGLREACGDVLVAAALLRYFGASVVGEGVAVLRGWVSCHPPAQFRRVGRPMSINAI